MGEICINEIPSEILYKWYTLSEILYKWDTLSEILYKLRYTEWKFV